jgi:hypothetical protein
VIVFDNNLNIDDETIIDNPTSGIIPLQYGSVLPLSFYHMDSSNKKCSKRTGGLQSPSRIEAVPLFTIVFWWMPPVFLGGHLLQRFQHCIPIFVKPRDKL